MFVLIIIIILIEKDKMKLLIKINKRDLKFAWQPYIFIILLIKLKAMMERKISSISIFGLLSDSREAAVGASSCWRIYKYTLELMFWKFVLVGTYGSLPLSRQGLFDPDEWQYSILQSGWYRENVIFVPEQDLTCSGIFYLSKKNKKENHYVQC